MFYIKRILCIAFGFSIFILLMAAVSYLFQGMPDGLGHTAASISINS